jgi:hypothetical protein
VAAVAGLVTVCRHGLVGRDSSRAGNLVLRPTSTSQRAEPGRQPVSRWIRAAAYTVPLCVLPSALWRLWALADGLPPGCRQVMKAWEPYYITGLSVVSFGAALLAIGLVRPWGEVVPGWVPLVGGRAVPVRAAVPAAGTGATVIFGVYAYALLNPILHLREPAVIPGCPSPLEGPGAWVAVASYAPLLAWGPLLVVVTVAHHRRRTHTTMAPSRTDRRSKLQAG